MSLRDQVVDAFKRDVSYIKLSVKDDQDFPLFNDRAREVSTEQSIYNILSLTQWRISEDEDFYISKGKIEHWTFGYNRKFQISLFPNNPENGQRMYKLSMDIFNDNDA